MSHRNQMEQMLAKMSEHGWRITDQRRSLAALFCETNTYLTPKEVYEYLKQQYPGVSFDTIYRNLRLLSDMGILEQCYFLEGGLKFRANCSDDHHHHVICLQCGKTVALEHCPMDHVVPLPAGFNVRSHRFEIFGFCQDCKEAQQDI